MEPLIHYLGQVLMEARENAGLARERLAATDPGGATTNTLFRLEQGKNGRYWPRQPDALVQLYADACGVDPLDIWEAAISRARNAPMASKKRS